MAMETIKPTMGPITIPIAVPIVQGCFGRRANQTTTIGTSEASNMMASVIRNQRRLDGSFCGVPIAAL
jgi:hypothetical protein